MKEVAKVVKPQTLITYLEKESIIKNAIRDDIKKLIENASYVYFSLNDINNIMSSYTKEEKEAFFEGFVDFVKKFVVKEVRTNSEYIKVARREKCRNVCKNTA